MLRIIVICLVALGPLGMAAAGVSDGDADAVSVDCHDISDKAADMTAGHCLGMGCCVMIEQTLPTITLAGKKIDPDCGPTAEPLLRQILATRPDKPPRLF